MESEKKTIEKIMSENRDNVEKGQPMSPRQYLQDAAQVNVLLQDLDEEIVLLKSGISNDVASKVTEGASVAKAKVMAQTGENYKKLLSLQAKRERAAEFIRIAKQMQQSINYGA